MPYSIDRKNKCVYKKKSDGSRGEKVGCTKGSLDDYIAALQMHAESKNVEEMDNQEQQEPVDGSLSIVYAVQKPYAGCELTNLVKPINPLLGIGAGHEIAPEQIHSVFADEPSAQNMASELFEDHIQKENALEEKKETTTKKIQSAIDMLEKKRKEHMKMAKEDPKNVSSHREQIATITGKIDDLMTKLEKIEKSKKPIQEGFFDRLKANIKGTGAHASTTFSNLKSFLKGDKEGIKDPVLAKNMAALQTKAKTLDKELVDVMNDIAKLFPADALEKAPAEFKTILTNYTTLLDKTKAANNSIVTGNVAQSTSASTKTSTPPVAAKPKQEIPKAPPPKSTNTKSGEEKGKKVEPPVRADQLLLIKKGTEVMYKGLTYTIKKDDRGKYAIIGGERININASAKKKMKKK
jgi:hypothetical protein